MRRTRTAAAGLSVLVLALSACGGEDGAQPAGTVAATDATPLSAAVAGAAPRVTRTITSGLTTPWGLAFLPDGSALVSERDTGRITKVTAAGRVTTIGTVPGSVHEGEGGLLGLALDPAYPRAPYVYAYTTTARDNRIVRMRWTGGALGRPQVLVAGIQKAGNHNGGRIAFGPDGMLYAGTGDASIRPNAQNRASLNGKILRMTSTGKVPAGNPFRGSLIWSLGHRNVQGFGWDAAGRMYADEFGQNTWDEVNRISPGRNYGWPTVEGVGHKRGFTDPILTWRTSDASPSGLAVVGSTAYVAALRGERLWAVPLRGGKATASFSGTYGRLRTVAVAPDGTLWLTTSNTDGRSTPGSGDDRILRVSVA